MIRNNMSREEVESAGISGASHTDLAKILNSFYLYTDPNELSVGQWLSRHGFWESWITSWTTKNINPGDVCLDIGANYGYYTRIMEVLATSSGKVYAFEANKSLSDLVNKSVEDYPVKNGAPITTFNVAVSDQPGIVTLNIPPLYLGGSSIVWGKQDLPSSIEDSLWTESAEVKADTIDNMLEHLDHINLIKMDIEGAEYLAWRGMQKTLDKTDLVVIELGSYSDKELKDDIYLKYNVSHIDIDGSEKELLRSNLDSLDDLTMAVLRRK